MAIRTKIVAVLAVSSILVTLLSTLAQELKPANQSPELRVLERFIGSWEETVVQKRAARTPVASTTKITSTRKWILGGKMIENKGAWSPDNVEFLHLMSYDPQRREFRQWYFDANNPASLGEDRGTWDEATQTLTWRGKLVDGATTETIERFMDKDNFTWTFVAKDGTGQVVLNMDAKVTRKQR